MSWKLKESVCKEWKGAVKADIKLISVSIATNFAFICCVFKEKIKWKYRIQIYLSNIVNN